ncbi:MAG: sigma 54-interacting transcriptional regulator [Polyangiaceae bacterium]
MSGEHAEIEREGSQFILRDCASRNHTFVNGVRVDEVALRDGDIVEAGNTFFLFRDRVTVAPQFRADSRISEQGSAAPLISLSPTLERTFQRLAQIAHSDVTVFVGGETGVGKEVVARATHDLSKRPGAFVAVNCSAIAPTLVESELFGHRRGAFSGAAENRPGHVLTADKGTLFLDEIGDMPLPAQAALLRVLQEREVLAVGASTPVKVDLRVIAATHRKLDELVASGAFRADLRARLMGIVVELPALRERIEDIGYLAASLVTRHFREARPLRLESARALVSCAFVGNVRELDRRIAAAAAFGEQGSITKAQLLFADEDGMRPFGRHPEPKRTAVDPADLSAEDAAQRTWLIQLLEEHDWNVSAVARASGKGRTQIQRWMLRYALRR